MEGDHALSFIDELKAQGKLTGPFIDGLSNFLTVSQPTRCIVLPNDNSSDASEKNQWVRGISAPSNGNGNGIDIYSYSTHWASDQYGGTYYLLPENTQFEIAATE